MLRELIITKAIEQAQRDGFVGNFDPHTSTLSVVWQSCWNTVWRTKSLCSKERWQRLTAMADQVAEVTISSAKADNIKTEEGLLLYLLKVDMEVMAREFDEHCKLIREAKTLYCVTGASPQLPQSIGSTMFPSDLGIHTNTVRCDA